MLLGAVQGKLINCFVCSLKQTVVKATSGMQNFTAKNIKGDEVSLGQFLGRPVLIENM